MMNRRNFLRNTSLAALALSSPISLSALDSPTKKVGRSGRLNLSFEPYELKLQHAFNLAKYSRTTTPDVQVQIEFDGIIGYGEASMPPYLGESVASVTKFLSSLDLAQFTDPFRIEEIHEYMDSIAPNDRAAKASIDIALHDLVGKIMGQPWYKIWGLSPEKSPNTSFTIGIDTAEVVRKKVEETAPYKVIKVKMGLDNDKELVEIIRSMTDKPICVDANQGWDDKEKALEMCFWLAERNCLFVEQPMPKEMIDETAWVRERSPLPIIADEFLQRLPDIARAKGVYDGINIKLMKSTGMHEAYKMAVQARAQDMKVMLGCMTETSCAVTAAGQLAPMVDWADLDGNLLIANDIFDGIKIVDGQVVVPADRPGIGVVPINR
ncbi:MAG: dipeptide epimerase [Muribaculaceae bacterium]|nr:dipeptide epimerase [Muribaculaceae bacterium]MBO7382727.1 dipeptide epimerase [Muribaculaceae bacterium]MBP5314836.1 dipeptide epimerase [Muribaculaceae bacterium]MBR4722951.1 dipeptide epimerase [Muribaculaceae bacterium]